MKPTRSFWLSLFWTSENHFDAGWFLTLLLAVLGALGFCVEVITGRRASLAAWSWLGASFTAVLIAAIPIAKARLLANSKTVGDVAKGIASAQEVTASTDVQEGYEKATESEAG